jgi:hypothetical protein
MLAITALSPSCKTGEGMAVCSESSNDLIQHRSSRMALRSPDAALFVSWSIVASNLLMWRLPPFSVTLTRCRPILWSKVAKFCEPLGLPFGFLDCPLVNCVRFGGLPYPIA